MRPVIEKNKFEPRHVAYIIIILICVIAIGAGVYMQFYQDEKLAVIFGITKEKEDVELKSLKENFLNNFNNDLNIIKNYDGTIQKIKEDKDIITDVYSLQEQNENYNIELKIPCFNIKSDSAVKINQKIKDVFYGKSKNVISSTSTDNTIFNVKYKAYMNDNILSLVILSELKEGDNNQRIIIKTYNYDLKENKEATINDIISSHNIDLKQANSLIKSTIDSSQDENLKLRDLGYPIDVRDSNSDEYKIENAKNYYLGDNGYLFLVYPYGNKELTSEMDLVIIR